MKDPSKSPTVIITAIVYTAIFITALSIIAYNEIANGSHSGAIALIAAIIIKGQAAAILAGGIAVAIEAGGYIMIIASYMLEKKREEVREKIANAEREASERAYARVNDELAVYHQRMQAAQESGEPFNEPPPRFSADEE